MEVVARQLGTASVGCAPWTMVVINMHACHGCGGAVRSWEEEAASVLPSDQRSHAHASCFYGKQRIAKPVLATVNSPTEEACLLRGCDLQVGAMQAARAGRAVVRLGMHGLYVP